MLAFLRIWGKNNPLGWFIYFLPSEIDGREIMIVKPGLDKVGFGLPDPNQENEKGKCLVY